MTGIYDLIYCEDQPTYNEIRSIVEQAHQQLKTSDGSDFVHAWRLVVEGEIELDDWLMWLMRQGLHNLSLHWQMTAMEQPDKMRGMVQIVLDEQKRDGVGGS